MPTIMEILLVVTCLGLGLLAYVSLAGGDPVRIRSLENLQQGFQPNASEAVGPRRLAGPSTRAGTRRWLPPGELALIDRLLSEAGRPAGWPLDRVISVKLFATVGAAVLGLLFYMGHPSGLVLLMALGLVVLAYAAPELRLVSIGIERREAILNELADTLDQMSIAVEAGLGFEAALVRVANNSDGVLAGELRRTAQDMQVGQPRRQAYLALADRTKVPELRRFVRTIVQAEDSGMALRDVLSTQAAEMRLVRRQRAEEKAMKIPVKVIFPLVFCILPVLFIVILGPAVINIARAFGG